MEKTIITKEQLEMLLETKVAIFDCDTEKQIDTTTVEGIAGGFDLYIDKKENKFYLYDFQDDEYEHELGSTIVGALKELNTFDEYFNNFYDNWYSDFTYYQE